MKRGRPSYVQYGVRSTARLGHFSKRSYLLMMPVKRVRTNQYLPTNHISYMFSRNLDHHVVESSLRLSYIYLDMLTQARQFYYS